MSDPRVAAVEENLVAFFDAALSHPMFEPSGDTDVRAVHSDVPVPLFNAVLDARFADDEVEERARAVVAAYVERGLPFLWWTTPSGHAERLRPVLLDLGLDVEDVPGMWRDLHEPPDPRVPAGATIEDAETPDAMRESIETMADGFGMPRDLVPPFLAVIERMGDSVVQVTARSGGRPVASGSAHLRDGTAGIYNIATVPEARGRGLGYAVTAALMNLARDRGCTQAVLHATEMGLPVYRRLGFETVCLVPQFRWAPPTSGSSA